MSPGLAAVALAIVLMAVAALENTVAPWAPFYVVYATLALVLPFFLRRGELGFVMPRKRFWLLAIGLAFAMQGIVRLITSHADLPGMFGSIFGPASVRLGRPPAAIANAYLAFIIIWAGLGEEVFYRGYLQARLRTALGPAASIGAASAVYAVRHYTQVLLAWPHVPWASATIWVTATFVVGIGFGWLYEKSGSLWPAIACHYVFNLLA